MSGFSKRSLLAAAAAISFAGGAAGQFYTFTSGPSGDGFIWDENPQGGLNNLTDGGQFDSPDGVSFNNFTNNNSFFDSSYQAAGNAPNISGDAWWGNPLDSGGPEIYIGFFNSPTGGPSTLSFDFAWALAGEHATDYLELYIYDYDAGPGSDETYERYHYVDLNEVWNAGGAFGGFDGRSGNIYIDINDLFDDNSGEPFTEIEDVGIYLGDIATFGGTGEYAIDNVTIDGSTGGGLDELYPSVNQGEHDATGVTLGSNSMRGSGTYSQGIEVTNDSGSPTTFSLELLPGGDLTAGTLPNGDFIDAGDSVFIPDIAFIDRSLPSGTYQNDVNVVNDGDPSDPDNVTTIEVDLYEPEQLSGNFASVDVSAAEQVTLANAAAPANGFRAAVKVTGTQTSGPFEVGGFNVDDRLIDGDTLESSATFNRFGQRSGTRAGTFTVSLKQTAYFINEFVDFEVYLANTVPVPDEVWNLSYTHTDVTSDSANIGLGEDFGPGKVGVNNAAMAATLIAGTSSTSQTIGMTIGTNPETGDPSADLGADPVDLSFGSPGDLYVLQFTYDAAALPAGLSEADILPLVYDTASSDWVHAADLNSDSGSGKTFYLGSFADFLAGTDGTLNAPDLGYFGVDPVNDHAWAVLDHNSLFGFGRLATAAVPGDTDGDGDIDDSDLGTSFANYTGPIGIAGGKTAADGDTDGDGDVDDSDLGTSFAGYTGPLGPTTVPEPASAALLAIGSALMLRRRKH